MKKDRCLNKAILEHITAMSQGRKDIPLILSNRRTKDKTKMWKNSGIYILASSAHKFEYPLQNMH